MADSRIDLEGVAAARDRFERAALGAGTRAIRVSTREVEQDVEGIVQGAVGGRLWRAISSRSYPKAGIARDPVGEIYLNGTKRTEGAFDFFTKPGRIRSANGYYLAVPLPAAGPRTSATRGSPRGPTPGQWERQHGIRLRFVYRPGKPPLLVADASKLNGKGVARPIKRAASAADAARGYKRGETTVAIFVLKPAIDFANRANIEPAKARAPGRLQHNFASELRGSAGRL